MYIETENSTLHDGIHCCDKFLWASHFHTSFGERGLISRSWLCRTGKTASCIFYAFIFLYVRNGKQRDLISSWKMSETQQHYKDLNHLWLLDTEMVLHFKYFSYCCSYFASKIWVSMTWKQEPIGRFSGTGLLEGMHFVIFHARSRERSQRTSGPISE